MKILHGFHYVHCYERGEATEMVQWIWYGNASSWLQPREVWNSHSCDHEASCLLKGPTHSKLNCAV